MDQTTLQPDRYVSFCGLECSQRAEHLVQRICALARQHETDNRFWMQLINKADAADGPDSLFLVHAYIFYMRELMEKHQDSSGLQMLDAIEYDCC